MNNLAVLIVDLDKMSKEAWSDLWKGSGHHAAKIADSSKQRVIDFLDTIQQDELDERNNK